MIRLRKFLAQNRFWVATYLVLLLFFFLVPLTGDDYTFLVFRRDYIAEHGYLNSFVFLYNHLNGRILGNGLEALLVGNQVVSAFIRAAFVLAIFYFGTRLTGKHSAIARNVLIVLMILVSPAIFSQTYAWSAGFYNYVTSTALVITICYILKRRFVDREQKPYDAPLLALLGFSACLFAENVTIISLVGVATMGALSIFAPKRASKLDRRATASLFFGVLLGAIVMFGSPVYRTVASGQDEYRSIAPTSHGSSQQQSRAKKVITSAASLSNILFIKNQTLTWSLSIISMYAFIAMRQKVRDNRLRHGDNAAFFIGAAYPIFALFAANFDSVGLPAYAVQGLMMAIVGMTILFCISIGYMMLRFLKANQRWLFIVYVYALALATPFLIVSPFGPRNVFATHILLVVVTTAVGVIAVLPKVTHLYSRRFNIQMIFWAALVSVTIIYFGMFSAIFVKSYQNADRVNAYMVTDSERLEILPYPFGDYLQDENSAKIIRYAAMDDCAYAVCQTKTKEHAQVILNGKVLGEY